MMRERKLSEVLKRGYSDTELVHIYELGRFFLESGKPARAQKIFSGLVSVAPEHAPSWLGLATVAFLQKNFESARAYAEAAKKLDGGSARTSLFLASIMFALNDLTFVGSLLGEAGDALESDPNSDPNLVRFYKIQLARFQALISQ